MEQITRRSHDPFCLSWQPPPKKLRLDDNEVHLWRASLDLGASQVDRLREILSAEEQKRAERFYFQKDRERFVAARGQLRYLLAGYLDLKAEALRFCYGLHGKPALSRAPVEATLRFNLSHSHGLALYAIAYGREIGVDLERICADLEYEQIIERFFSDQEKNQMNELPSHLKRKGFFTLWTLKEAYLKARGEGLFSHLDQFDILFSLEGSTPSLNLKRGPKEAARWSLGTFTPAPGYQGAISVEGNALQLRCFHTDGIFYSVE